MTKTQELGNPDGLLQDVKEYLDESEALLERGEYGELLLLNQKVAALCESVESLSIDESVKYRDEIRLMAERLTALQVKMAEHRDAIGGELNKLHSTRSAAHAYSRSHSLKGKDEE
jgi:hypothetical protein